MEFTPQFFVQVLIGLGAGVGAYAAIRYDLGKLHEKAQNAHDSAKKAHERIDSMLTRT